MNAQKLSLESIKEAIAQEDYVVTGILSTGEITIAILTDLEQTILEKINTNTVDQILHELQRCGHYSDLEFKAAFEVRNGIHFESVCLKNKLPVRHLANS